MNVWTLRLVVMLSFFGISSIQAAQYYVAPDGNDSAAGTIEAPFRSFLPAVTRARPGDTIFVRGGRYGEDNVMVVDVYRHHEASSAEECTENQTFADNYCFEDVPAMIGIKDFSGWASQTEAYSVRSGTEAQPITITNYADETPVLDVSGLLQEAPETYCVGSQTIAGCDSNAVLISKKAYWVIEGLEIKGGIVKLWGGSVGDETHDIMIRNNRIHDVTLDGGNNQGLVKIDRGDLTGAYNIFIHNNRLYNLFDFEFPGDWKNATDAQHFGAVTTLSHQHYSREPGGTGYIEIKGNHISHVPQAFFFKNAMAGPIEISENTISNCGSLGIMLASNVHMFNNLVYGVQGGFWTVGGVEEDLDWLNALSGQNAIIENNSFVGLESLMGILGGTGHLIRHNVFFGLTGRREGAGYDTPAYITKSSTAPDSESPGESILQQITSDENCFISPYDDFLFVKRHLESGDDYYTQEEAEEAFSFDTNSLILQEDDSAEIFVDPNENNYTLLDGICAGMGADEPVDSLPEGWNDSAESGGGGCASDSTSLPNSMALLIVWIFLAFRKMLSRGRILS